MNLLRVMNQTGLGFSALFMITTSVHAGIPLWSITPNGSTAISVSATSTATVSYTVTNNSKNPHQLVLSTKTPTGISQTGGPCVLAAKSAANPNPTCPLTLSIHGSALPANNLSGGPFLCQTNPNGTPNDNQCYQPAPNDVLVITRPTTPGTTTLSTSIMQPSILALSVNNTALNTALTGNARYITIQNTGINQAIGLSVSATGLPPGTSIATIPTTCTGTLAPSAACTVTITPGLTASSNCTTGIEPTSGTITVSATNVAIPATSNVVVLSYGCQYQGGFLYSVDDTTNNGVTGACTTPPCTQSIGGKVVSLTDQAAPEIFSGAQATSIIWSSNGSGSASANVSYDVIPLIADLSTSNDSYGTAQLTFNSTYSNSGTFTFPTASAFTTCSGASQGSCNSNNILALYNTYTTGYGIGASPYTISSGPTNQAYYAAGLCRATINTYSDWYLPAICEMDAVGTPICSVVEQSMAPNLSFLFGDPSVSTPSTSCTPPSGTDCLAGGYWSSTEYSGNPQYDAWYEFFNSVGGSFRITTPKYVQLGVRCSRALTL